MSEIHVVLIGCTKSKQHQAAAAKHMYATSPWFRSAWAYAKWRATNPLRHIHILSAEYGLLVPTQVIEPYDTRMSGRRHVRLHWAMQVRSDLRAWYSDKNVCFWLIAGKYYRDPLASLLHMTGHEPEPYWRWRVEQPLAHTPGISKQRAWLQAAKVSLYEQKEGTLAGHHEELRHERERQTT